MPDVSIIISAFREQEVFGSVVEKVGWVMDQTGKTCEIEVKTDIARRFVSILPSTFSYPTTLTMAVVVFMMGLVSEQIAQLRYDRSEPRE